MLPNDITRAVDGADNLRVSVTIINAQNDPELGEPRQMVVGWRKGRSSLGVGPLRELFDAALRWALDVDRRHLPVVKVLLTLRLDMPDLLRLSIVVNEGNDCQGEYTGTVRLEEDDLHQRPGPTFLAVGGTLQELEDAYRSALRAKGEQP